MKNIFLIVMMGSGKSTIAKLLSKELSIQYFDNDDENDFKQQIKYRNYIKIINLLTILPMMVEV